MYIGCLTYAFTGFIFLLKNIAMDIIEISHIYGCRLAPIVKLNYAYSKVFFH